MQKKILLLCIVVNCTIVQASETETVNQKDYAEYNKQQEELYHAALIKALRGEKDAIENEDKANEQISENTVKENEQKNKKEEEDKRKQYYDGQPGWWGSEPTAQSKVGRKFQQYAQERIDKNQLNAEDRKNKDTLWRQYSQKTKEKKDIFNKELLSQFKYTLEDRRYQVCKNQLDGLRNCRDNLVCYDKHGLSSTIFTNPHFGAEYELELYKDFVKLVTERNILLTIDELKQIAQDNPETKKLFEELQNGITRMSEVRDEILNPKKQEEA